MFDLLLRLTDPVPTDNAVVQGPWGAAVFVFLLVAIAFLGWSFSRQMKKVAAAREAGRYDESDKPDDKD